MPSSGQSEKETSHVHARTLVMGIINVTPDSFSGDGVHGKSVDIGELAATMVADGADMIDVGGESTRPGYTRVALDEELDRVIPAVRSVSARVSVPICVDTTKVEVARQALVSGASIINDVSGSADRNMAILAAEARCGLILVHHGRAQIRDHLVVGVVTDLEHQKRTAIVAGVPEENIIVDPGIGIGKDWLDNFEIIRGLEHVRAIGRPILVGPSRKGMIGRVLGTAPGDRLEGTAALVAICIANGAGIVRVHDVREMVRVARMTDVLARGGAGRY